jgi:rare lipoprotein A
LAAAFLSTGCRKRKARLPVPPPVPASGEEIGVASWYGHPYHGRRTANGEVYDMDLLTAAHRTRPFNQWVRVHNLDNGKTVEVRINDRGPFIDNRIIDLSRAAARTIEMIGPGTVLVRVETIPEPCLAYPRAEDTAITEDSSPVSDTRAPKQEGSTATGAVDVPVHEGSVTAPASLGVPRFGVQVGAFANIDNAEDLSDRMNQLHGAARIVERDGGPPVWRVIVGDFPDRAGAEALAETIRGETGAAFVVRLDDTDVQY